MPSNVDVINSIRTNTIAVRADFLFIAGSESAGIFLSQAWYWQKHKKMGTWWWKTHDQWTKETLLTRRKQEAARKRLLEIGVLEEKRYRQGGRLWYRINDNRLAQLVREHADDLEPLPDESADAQNRCTEPENRCTERTDKETTITRLQETVSNETDQHSAEADQRPRASQSVIQGMEPDDVDEPENRRVTPPRKRPRSVAAHAIPSDFQPDARTMEILGAKGIPDAFVRSEVAEFVAYWEETGGGKKSWQSTFRNRVVFQWTRYRERVGREPDSSTRPAQRKFPGAR